MTRPEHRAWVESGQPAPRLSPNPYARYRDGHLYRLLRHLHGELAGERHPLAHVVHAVIEVLKDSGGAICPTCGSTISQPARGRRRLYCSRSCREKDARLISRSTRAINTTTTEGEAEC